jgi:hypothetical protein
LNTTYSYGPDYFVVDNYRKSPLKRSDPFDRKERDTAAGNNVFHGFRRPFETDGCLRLSYGDIHASDLGIVHSLKEDEMPARVQDGNCDIPIIFPSFRFRSCHGSLGIIQRYVFSRAWHLLSSRVAD